MISPLSEEQQTCPVLPPSHHCLLLPALLSHINCGTNTVHIAYNDLSILRGMYRHPSIAQLVERWTVVVEVIHRSLVRIRLEGYFFSPFIHCHFYFSFFLLVSMCLEKCFPFVCDVVLKLLLAQDNFREIETNARLLLLQKDKWMSRQEVALIYHCMNILGVCVPLRSWFPLSHSLARLLQWWTRDTSIPMEVRRSSSCSEFQSTFVV